MYNEKEVEKAPKDNKFDVLNSSFLSTRTIFIYGEINQEIAQKVSAQLIMLSHESDAPIKIFINSQGGHVESGDTIHDMIKFIKNKVYMIGTGWVASAGVTIYLGAEKENRFALPNTRFMIHQPSGGARGQATDVEIEMKEIIRTQERINRLISNATGQPFDRVAKDTDRNYWMSNAEAIEYGIVAKEISSYDMLPQ